MEISVFVKKDEEAIERIADELDITTSGYTSWDKKFVKPQPMERVYFTVYGQTHNIETGE